MGEWCGCVARVVGYWCTSSICGHHEVVSLAEAPALIDPVREPADWIDDMRWHRRMFSESKVRWAPEDAHHVALAWTGGRCSFETPGQLRRLDAQLLQLREYAAQIQDAMAPELRRARNALHRSTWAEALLLIGLSHPESVFIISTARRLSRSTPNAEVRRALRGIPLPNPLNRVWELRQMHALYLSAVNLLEDATCDLAVELAATRSWDSLAALTTDRIGWQLQGRVEDQREARGLPGDPRRTPAQQY